MPAGLSSPTLNQRYIQLVGRELMLVYCRELRHHCGIPDRAKKVSEQEVEFLWGLHGGIFYSAVRQHVYKMRVKVDFMTQVGFAVDNFLVGAELTYPALVAGTAPLSGSRTRIAAIALPR